MMQAVRRELIAAELEQRRFMSVETIATRFHCSPATARRDLQALATVGRIRRSRGGALVAAEGAAVDREVTEESGDDPLLEAKRRIGQATASLITEGETIGISGGSTTIEVARCLRGRRIGVITNAVVPAMELASSPRTRVVLIGGMLDYANGREMVGPLAELLVAQVTMDVVILGVNGINVDAGATVFDDLDAQVRRIWCTRARKVVIVADHTKLGRASLASFIPIAGVHTLVTDLAPENAVLAAIRAAGVHVVEA